MTWPEIGPRPHEFAGIFRMLVGEEKETLAANVVDKGLRERVKIFEEKILDGRNRYLVLVEEGIFDREIEGWEERPELFERFEGTREEALDYVWSLNAERRHDNAGQRALAAERYANLRGVTKAEAAAKLGVSERQVSSAAKVLEQGEPELVQAVEEGRLPLYLGEQMADRDPEEQREVAELPKREASAKAKEKLAPLPTLGEAMGLPPVAPPSPPQPTREEKAVHRMMPPQGRPYISFVHHVIEGTRGVDAVPADWLRALAEEYRLITTAHEGVQLEPGAFLWPVHVIQHEYDVGGVMPGPAVIARQMEKLPQDFRQIYDEALAGGADLKGQHSKATAEPILRAGVAAKVPVRQMAADLGHKLGTVQSWTARLALTDPSRSPLGAGASE